MLGSAIFHDPDVGKLMENGWMAQWVTCTAVLLMDSEKEAMTLFFAAN